MAESKPASFIERRPEFRALPRSAEQPLEMIANESDESAVCRVFAGMTKAQ
mgnify:FL=1